MSPMVIHMLLFALLITLPIVLVLLLVAYWRRLHREGSMRLQKEKPSSLWTRVFVWLSPMRLASWFVRRPLYRHRWCRRRAPQARVRAWAQARVPE